MSDIAAEAQLGRVRVPPGPDRGGGSPHAGRCQRGS
jgi:hypothetical protein